MTQFLLALDIGTSSTRAILYDAATGLPIPDATRSVQHEPDVTADGGSTLDPGALLGEVVACLGGALAKGGATDPGSVLGVGVCTFWHSFVGVDAEGHARTPIYLWSDRRSAAQVARLRDADPDSPERTGCPPHTSYVAGRLLWLRETEPELYASCARFVSPGEFLFGRLFGVDKVTCSVSMASASGLMDQKNGRWDDALLQRLGNPPLSPISDEPVSGLLSPHRGALPGLANVPFFPAYGDGACSNMGSGASEPNTIALMIGTSGALRVVVDGFRPLPPGLWRYQADANRFLIGGALSNGGNVWAWLKDTLRLPESSDDTIEAELTALPPDGHGLTVLPFLNGERAPSWRDDARAVIAGLSAATTPTEIVRAHLEAVAYRFAAVRDRLKTVTGANTRIVGTGAGLKASPAWTQILADVLESPIAVATEEQASARGAMLLVRERLGLGKVADAPIEIERTVTPILARSDIYRAARARQDALIERISGVL